MEKFVPFSDYFLDYLKNSGRTKRFVAEISGLNYTTLCNKFNRNSFTYDEVIFFDNYFGLNYISNYIRFFELRRLAKEHDSNK